MRGGGKLFLSARAIVLTCLVLSELGRVLQQGQIMTVILGLIVMGLVAFIYYYGREWRRFRCHGKLRQQILNQAGRLPRDQSQRVIHWIFEGRVFILRNAVAGTTMVCLLVHWLHAGELSDLDPAMLRVSRQLDRTGVTDPTTEQLTELVRQLREGEAQDISGVV